MSPATRASTPGSPRSITTFAHHALLQYQQTPRPRSTSDESKASDASVSTPAETNIEAELGRKRCISFVCGKPKESNAAAKPPTEKEPTVVAEQPKRPCAIKFLCPATKAASQKSSVKDGHPKLTRHHSPAPPPNPTSPKVHRRGHRDSDSTVKNDSPKSVTSNNILPTIHARKFSNQQLDLARTEATRFHEFASSEDEGEDWLQEPTGNKSRLTVADTLKKENDIRQLAEEVEEEALEEEDADFDDDTAISDSQLFSDDEDEGFRSDDEEGFAESDEEEDDSDPEFEWWAPRRSDAGSPLATRDTLRPSSHRNGSDSSVEATSPRSRPVIDKRFRRVRPVAIHPNAHDLPDSTDFVCGTLDEDRPLEQAYINRLKERQAAKHRKTPQDIDPTFPTSDTDGEDEDEDLEDIIEDAGDDEVNESDHPIFLHGHFEPDEEESRGRKPGPAHHSSPLHSPKRFGSPPAHKRSSTVTFSPPPPTLRRVPTNRSPPPPPLRRVHSNRSPAPPALRRVPTNHRSPPPPRGLFNHSPKRMRSPPSVSQRMTSPPPSRRESAVQSPAPLRFGPTFLAQRNYELTHTASLPRSPHPFGRRRTTSTVKPLYDEAEEDDDADDTEHDKPYSRGAIDIVQGLERRRLKRREKDYKHYWKREEKKNHTRRPQPGKGAERMRQIGLECAVYRGKRVLSI